MPFGFHFGQSSQVKTSGISVILKNPYNGDGNQLLLK